MTTKDAKKKLRKLYVRMNKALDKTAKVGQRHPIRKLMREKNVLLNANVDDDELHNLADKLSKAINARIDAARASRAAAEGMAAPRVADFG